MAVIRTLRVNLSLLCTCVGGHKVDVMCTVSLFVDKGRSSNSPSTRAPWRVGRALGVLGEQIVSSVSKSVDCEQS